VTQPLHTFVHRLDVLDPAVADYTPASASIVDGGLQLVAGFVDPSDANEMPDRFAGEWWSVASFDARGSSLTVELAGTNGMTSGVTELGVFDAADPRSPALLWRVQYEGTSPWGFVLSAVIRDAADATTTVASLYPDPQEYRWLRISEDAGTAYWWTSPDGLMWKPAGQVAHGIPDATLAAVRVTLATRYTSPGDASPVGSALFASLNIDQGAADPTTVTGEDGDPYLAVDVQPDNRTGVFVVGASTVGGPDRLAWSNDDVAAWTNVVCNVRSMSYRRGASRELGLLTRTEAGMGTVVVEDTAGQFDPNLGGHAIRKGTPARLRAWGTDPAGERWDAVLFTGELDDLAAEYLPEEDAPLVTLTLLDLVGPLAAWESPGVGEAGVGAGENLLARAQRILATVGRGEVSSASSSNYTATLAPTPLARPWDELQDATEAELGRLWVDRHNRLQLRARGSQPTGPVQGTLSDVHGEAPLGVHACMQDAVIRSGGDGVVNRTLAARRRQPAEQTQPPTVQRDDERSQRDHGVATAGRTDLMLQTDAQVAAWAGALITARTRPELRVESVTPRPSAVDLDSTLEQWRAVLQTDLGDRWLFHRHPRVGPAIVRGLAVLGIGVEATPAGWTITWTTEPAAVPGADNPTGWFVVGLSQVGGSDLLAPYAAPYSAA
jgi:hypothetical protein